MFVTFTTETDDKFTIPLSRIHSIEWFSGFDRNDPECTAEGLLTLTDGEEYDLGLDNDRLKKAVGYEG